MFFLRAQALFILLVVGGLAAGGQTGDFLDELNGRMATLLAGSKRASDPQHTPRLRVPRVVEVADEVRVTVSVPLIGDDKHYIRRLVLIDENSLVKVKYVATFSPLAQPVEVTTFIKMAKSSQLKAIAECSLHGKWLGVSERIRVGVSGCGAGLEPARQLVGEVLRVRFQPESQGVRTHLLFRHPMISGYVPSGEGGFRKSYEPFFLRTARVIFGGQVLAEFEIGPGLSENPQISFWLPRLGNEPLKAEAGNTAGQQFALLARMPQ